MRMWFSVTVQLVGSVIQCLSVVITGLFPLPAFGAGTQMLMTMSGGGAGGGKGVVESGPIGALGAALVMGRAVAALGVPAGFGAGGAALTTGTGSGVLGVC